MTSRIFKPVFVAALALAAASFADEAIRFVPEVFPMGEVAQGDQKHYVLQGANTTGAEIVLENVFGQGIGMSNFKFPQKIAPNATVTIEFDMDFAGMEGKIDPTVVLVAAGGKPYTANLSGVVKAPVFFGEKMFDAGFYKAGEKREWTFYVWETDKKARPDIELSPESARSRRRALPARAGNSSRRASGRLYRSRARSTRRRLRKCLSWATGTSSPAPKWRKFCFFRAFALKICRCLTNFGILLRETSGCSSAW